MLRIGRQLGGLAAIALGAVMLRWGDFCAPWQRVPEAAPFRHILALAAAAVLIAAGAALFLERTAKPAALVLGVLSGLFALLWLPPFGARPDVFDDWGTLAEMTAVTAGYLATLAALARRDSDASARLALAARVVFGCCALVFGAIHLVYVQPTASFVPKWIPGGGVFWTVVTGAAHIASGIAILSGIWAQLAARLAALMYIGFGLLAWGAVVAAHPAGRGAWSGEAINFTLVAAAWMVADSIAAFPPMDGRLFQPRRRAA